MKISIIIPVYNKEKWINRLIDSIECQDYKDYEIIFIDDGSTDNSANIIKQRMLKDKKIFLFSQKKQGPGKARLNGFNKSKGDLIYFVDADDFLPNKDVLLTISRIFKNDIDILLFNRDDILDNKTEVLYFFDRAKEKINSGFYDINNFPEAYIHGGLGCKIFKRRILKDEMFIDFYNFEDSYTSYMYLDKCNNYFYLDESLYSIWDVSENISLTKSKSFNGPMYIIEKLKVLILLYNNLNTESLRKSVVSIYPTTIISTYKYLLNNKIEKEKKNQIKNYLIEMKIICKKEIKKPNFKCEKFPILRKIIFQILLKIK